MGKDRKVSQELEGSLYGSDCSTEKKFCQEDQRIKQRDTIGRDNGPDRLATQRVPEH